MSSNEFEKCLKESIEKNEQFIDELAKLKDETNTHHNYCNGIKTVGTVAGATGTTVLVASVMAIPFTGGLSMLGTAGGLALSVGGGATTVVTDIVDSYSTQTIIKTIEELVESKQKLNNNLQKHFDSIESMKQQLVSNDVPHESALFSILTGIANEQVDLKEGVGPSSAVVRLFTNMSRLSHAEELLFQTSHLGLKGLEKVASKVLPALGISGQMSAHAFKTLTRFATAFSVAMTVVDIGLLIRDWSSNHPTIVVIDELIAKVNEENQSLNEIYSLMDSLKERVYYTIVEHRIPIVGATDVFNQVIVHLLNKEPNKCRDVLKTNYEIDISFNDLQTTDNIVSYLATSAASGYHRDEIEEMVTKSGKTCGQAVKDLSKNLLTNLEVYKNVNKVKGVRAQPVIDTRVMSIYKEIIDVFVRHIYGCDFADMTRIPTDSVVYNDYYSPHSTTIRHNIEEVLFANIPDHYCYFNSNAVIYDLLMSKLKELAKMHMVNLYNTDFISASETDHTSKIKSIIYLISQCRLYVDEFALQYWLTHNNGNRNTFDECGAGVHATIHNLYDKMRVWVHHIKQYHPNRLYPEL